jgi:hypothetical protein
MNKITKLYSVISPMPSFDSWKGDWVTVWWYRADKIRNGLKYDEIIKGYNDMTQEDKRLYEACVNELFTSDEVKALRKFVEEELDRKLLVEFEFDLSKPLSEQEYYGLHDDSEHTIYLNMIGNYNLPFEVRGNFMPEQGEPIIKHWTVEKFMKPVKK